MSSVFPFPFVLRYTQQIFAIGHLVKVAQRVVLASTSNAVASDQQWLHFAYTPVHHCKSRVVASVNGSTHVHPCAQV
jgi:hypothetical protein